MAEVYYEKGNGGFGLKRSLKSKGVAKWDG